jgi:hypothetical protein
MFSYESFSNNKYKKWYVNLIESRKFNTKVQGETEAHHVFPQSIYGKNKFVVNLTHKEHYIAHLLLYKIFKNNDISSEKKMLLSLLSMMKLTNTKNNRIVFGNSRLFEMCRKNLSSHMSQQSKEMWDDDAIRSRLTKHRQEYWDDEENRSAQSNRRNEYFSIEENRRKQTEINKEITSRESWRKQRSEKQKEFSADPEYTKYRIDAMTTPEARERSRQTFIENAAKMTPEEKIKRFGTNSGKHWITNGVDSKSVPKNDEIPEGWRKGRVIKKTE